ncbi:hypothetical protein IUU84_03880 [Kocuria rhizophila]|uniref:hypothetical protein n=1 Tax=Kocuria rhizophila TaxID=72000 RepID=UPI002949A68F|nr:hypothetical protein [Kocuria rhizophila]MDV5998726.1 hypothetical protein [Kocuria rhizophila]
MGSAAGSAAVGSVRGSPAAAPAAPDDDAAAPGWAEAPADRAASSRVPEVFPGVPWGS